MSEVTREESVLRRLLDEAGLHVMDDWHVVRQDAASREDVVKTLSALTRALKAALDVLARRKAAIVTETETALAEYDAPASAPDSWTMLATRYLVVRFDAPALHQAAVFVAPDGRRFAFRAVQSRADADRMVAVEREAIVLAVEPRWSLPTADWVEADPAFWKASLTRDT